MVVQQTIQESSVWWKQANAYALELWVLQGCGQSQVLYEVKGPPSKLYLPIVLVECTNPAVCLTCSDAQTCTSCATGYYLDSDGACQGMQCRLFGQITINFFLKKRTSVIFLGTLKALFWTSGDICPEFPKPGWLHHVCASLPAYEEFLRFLWCENNSTH